MPARLFCKTGEFAGAAFEIGREATIGRGPDGGVGVPSEIVSGRHARIYFDENENSYFLEDLGSRNGTKLDGLSVGAPRKLGSLHVITLADRIDLIYHKTDRAAGAPAASNREAGRTQVAPFPAVDLPLEQDASKKTQIAAFPALGLPPETDDEGRRTLPEQAHAPLSALPGRGAMEAAPIGEMPRFALATARPGDVPETFLLVEGENTVGRAPECAITLNTASVSRHHAVLTVRAGRVTVRDLGSRNKTFFNGEPVDSEVEVLPGATLRFGIEIEATLRRA